MRAMDLSPAWRRLSDMQVPAFASPVPARRSAEAVQATEPLIQAFLLADDPCSSCLGVRDVVRVRCLCRSGQEIRGLAAAPWRPQVADEPTTPPHYVGAGAPVTPIADAPAMPPCAAGTRAPRTPGQAAASRAQHPPPAPIPNPPHCVGAGAPATPITDAPATPPCAAGARAPRTPTQAAAWLGAQHPPPAPIPNPSWRQLQGGDPHVRGGELQR